LPGTGAGAGEVAVGPGLRLINCATRPRRAPPGYRLPLAPDDAGLAWTLARSASRWAAKVLVRASVAWLMASLYCGEKSSELICNAEPRCANTASTSDILPLISVTTRCATAAISVMVAGEHLAYHLAGEEGDVAVDVHIAGLPIS
jgi:hypothetical protein